MCTVMCFLLAVRDDVLSSRALDPRMVLDLGVLVVLSSDLRQLIDDIGLSSIVEASSFDPVLSYVAYYRSEEVEWSTVDLSDPFTSYDFGAGRVHPLPEEVVSSRKHAHGHRFSDRLLSSVPVCYREGPSQTLGKAVRFVQDQLGRSGLVVW